MVEPAGRRMEAVRRHLLPPTPVLRPNPLSSLAVVEPSPVIIGGMVLDIHAKPSVPPHPGTTVPGMVKYISGGVARNIAECMSKLGTRPFMISVVGNDMAGDLLLKYWKSAGLCTEGILQVHDATTPVVSNVFDSSGELIAGVASVGAVENFLIPRWIYHFRLQISSAPLLMLDANLPPESLEAACMLAYESGVPVLFEPVSVVKSTRIAPIAEYITCTSPNEIELVAMANALSPSVKYNFHKMKQCKDKADAVEYLFEMLSPAMFSLLEKGIKMLIVTLGSNGVFICCKEHTNFMKDQRKCKQTPFSTLLLEKLDGSFTPNTPINLCGESSSRTCVFHLPAVSASVSSLTGAGDCLVGGVLSALCGGLDIIRSVAVGVAIAKASVESEANIPDNISAASVADDAKRILLSAKKLWCK
uniref:Carbohydrate kinase PfkB domain-containing protein n=1 Tax=Arundo donax TaxID=35708 RepID=A0A0A8Y7A1_ARUDO